MAAAERAGATEWLHGRLRNIAPFVTLLVLVVFLRGARPPSRHSGNLDNILTQISRDRNHRGGFTFVILCAEIDLGVAQRRQRNRHRRRLLHPAGCQCDIANVPLPGWAAITDRTGVCCRTGDDERLRVTRDRHPELHHDARDAADRGRHLRVLVRGQIAYAVPPSIATLGSESLGPVPGSSIVAALFLLGRPCRAHLHAVRPLHLHDRRQSRGGGIFRRQCPGDPCVGDGDFGGVLGLAGMLGVAYFGSAQQNEFDTYLLDSISAVVVGGTSLFGGQGGIGNTIIGLFVLGVLNNGLDHINIDSFLKILIRGVILLVALVINVYAQRMRTAREG